MASPEIRTLTMRQKIQVSASCMDRGEILRTAKNSERNRAIFSAHSAGESLASLCQKYGLKPGSLYAVIMAEKHRRAFSTQSIYQQARYAALKIPRHPSSQELA